MQPYTHFTLTERARIKEMHRDGMSMRKIAEQLNRNPSSVSRELRRAWHPAYGYCPWWATKQYIKRRKNCVRKPRIGEDKQLEKFIEDSLDKYWSPEIIVAKWKEFDPCAKLSHSTIYSWIKSGHMPRHPARKCLRRRNILKYKNHNSMTIKPHHLISDRPESVNNRKRIGDWEGDMVHGGLGKGYIVTCIDRKTRYLTAAIAHDMRASTIRQIMRKALHGLPVKTLTLDRGVEFAEFTKMEKEIGCTIYFADPRSPWQRGSNENVNGLLRFFFPRGVDFKNMTKAELNEVVDLINTRPRKCLDWLSPKEVFFSKCCN